MHRQDNAASEFRIVPSKLGAEHFDIVSALMFMIGSHKGQYDEWDTYMSHVHPPSLRKDFDDDMGVVRFWHRHFGRYAALSKVA